MNADLTVQTERLPKPGETVTGSELKVLPGGKSANQAAVAAKLGADVKLVGMVGDDPNGKVLLDSATRSRVDVSHVGIAEGTATGTAMIAVDSNAENFIIISPGANGLVSAETVAEHEALLDGAGALCLCLEVEMAAVVAAATAAKSRGVPVVFNLSPSMDVPPELLEATDVLLVNEHELADLVGNDDLETAPAELAQRGINRAVITLGAQGSLVIDGSSTTRVAAVPVEAVDTTGCGDAFTGTLAWRLAEGDCLVKAAEYAAVVGAFAATRPGAQASYPTPAELAAFTG